MVQQWLHVRAASFRLSVDGIACCDCIMCYIAQSHFPSWVAGHMKSVPYLREDQKLWESDGQQEKMRANARQEQETDNDNRGESVWVYPPLSVSAFVIITSRLLRLVPLQRYIDHRRASLCPHGGGQGNQKGNAFLWRKQRKACQHFAFSCIPVCCAVALSVQRRSFTSAAGAGTNLALIHIYLCYWKCISVCERGGGGDLVPSTHSAACLSS